MFGKKPDAKSLGSKESKLSVLKDIMGNMDGKIKDGLASKKPMKVSVLAPDKAGLEKGLEAAEDVVDGEMPEFGEEASGSDELDTLIGDKSVPELEEMCQKIQDLIAQKQQLLVK